MTGMQKYYHQVLLSICLQYFSDTRVMVKKSASKTNYSNTECQSMTTDSQKVRLYSHALYYNDTATRNK